MKGKKVYTLDNQNSSEIIQYISNIRLLANI